MKKPKNRILRVKIVEKFDSNVNFADHIGVYPPDVSNVIHGRRNLSEKERHRWAGALGARASEIFEDKGG